MLTKKVLTECRNLEKTKSGDVQLASRGIPEKPLANQVATSIKDSIMLSAVDLSTTEVGRNSKGRSIHDCS